MGGNAVHILLDGDQNYPRWLQAIDAARRTIHLEMYIVHNDVIGRRFRDALVARAAAGVTVRVLYDWFGALRPSSFRFWAPLVRAGGEVRVVNAPRFHTLFNLGSRDHRKLLTVDGQVAYIGGLCIGDDWLGDPARQIPAWRDTGVELRGPAVAEAELAFAGAWADWGEGLPPGTVPARRVHPRRGQRQRARGGDLAGSHHAVPPRTGRACRGQRPHLAHRRLLHGDGGVHRVAQRGITAWSRRAAAGAQQQRHALGRQPVAHAVSPAARRRRPHLRVERPDGPRQDGRGRSAVRPRRLDEPEPVELDGQLGARRRHRGCGRGGADGGDLRPGPAQRHRDRHHRAQHRPAAIGAAAPADGARPPAAPAAGPRRQRQCQPHDQGRRAGGLRAGIGRSRLSRPRPARSPVAGDDGALAALVAAVAFAWPRAFAYPLGALSVVGALTLLLAPGGHDADRGRRSDARARRYEVRTSWHRPSAGDRLLDGSAAAVPAGTRC